MPQITPANKIKNNKRAQAGRDQTPKELIPTPELKRAFINPTAHPPQPARNDGLKVDSKQSHHTGVPLDSFTEFTEGFTENQKQSTRIALERQGLLTGDHLLNSTDLWRRYHQGRASGPYKDQGAHQRSNALGIDGSKSKQKWQSLSPEERFNQLESFVSDMGTNRKIAQESDFASRQLLGSNNTLDNEYGGNFSQRILNPRNPKNAALNSANANAQRVLYTPSVPRDMSPATRQAFNDLPKTPKARLPKGVGKAAKYLLPGASLSIGFGQAGHAASQGDYAGAAAHGVGALVGEIPIIGDVAVESIAGSSVADGTLDANLNRVPKQGPVNTAAPTGDKKFDNVFQPFNQMLNGITPTPKKPGFNQTAISAFETP